MLLVFVVMALLLLAAILLWVSARNTPQTEIDWAARVAGDAESAAAAALQQTGVPRRESWLNRHLMRAGLEPNSAAPRRYLMFVGFIVVLGTVFAGAILGIVLLLVFAAWAWFWLLNREAKRRARILEQLPDFVEHMVRALSAGNSLEESMYSATADAEQPIRNLFISVGRQVRLGAPIEEVLDKAADDYGVAEIRVMAMAARVNRRFGGSLKRIFKSMVQAIRERDAATRELRALTAETRFSAVVLAVVPIALSGYILLQNPDYYLDMWNQSAGRVLLLISGALQVAGVAVIWRMLRVAETEA